MKNKTIYTFPKEGNYSLKFPEMPLKITISCDGSNAIISTSKALSLLYFRKLFNKEKLKKMLKQEYCDLYKNIGPIEMHPFFDEKEYFAGAYENNIFVLKVSKNSLNINDAKKMTNQHWDNIRFLAWQHKQNGLLASTSSDKTINLYDIRGTRNPVIKIIDDDVVKNIKFSITNSSLLATGYDKRIKIFDLKRSTNSPIIVKEIFDGAVDILEWHNSQSLLLCGSRQNNILKIFSVKETLEEVGVIKIKDLDIKDENNINAQKIIKGYFLPGNGVIAVCEKKAFLYHLGANFSEVIFDQILNFENVITNFKLMTNNLNNHYFVYTDRENNFVTRQYTFDEIISQQKSSDVAMERQNLIMNNSLSNNKKNLFFKEIDILKKRYPNNISVEAKPDRNFYIFKLFQDLITIKIKVTLNDNYPRSIPSVDFDNKYESFLIDRTLISNIQNEILVWQEKSKTENINHLERLINSLMKVISCAKIVIEDNDENTKRLLKNKGKEGIESSSIVPYVKTCSFSWGPRGQMLLFSSNKIDFQQLKPSDKMISNFNNLEDWIKFCEASDQRNKFSKSENKLIEDDSDTIITERLRSIVDWSPIMEMEDSMVLSSINRIDSLPHIFAKDYKEQKEFKDIMNSNNLYNSYDIQNEFISKNNRHGSSDYLLLSHQSVEINNGICEVRKKSFISIQQVSSLKSKFILENLKLKLLSRDHFYASINFLIKSINYSEVNYLIDILDMLNFYINSIIDTSNTSELLVKHYKLAIITTIKTLEKDKNYEYLYICILLITSRIFDSLIREFLKVPSLIVQDMSSSVRSMSKYFNKKKQTNQINKKNSHTSLGSEKIVPIKQQNKLSKTNKTIKPMNNRVLSYANLYRHRSSSFDESSRFEHDNYINENSELQLNDEESSKVYTYKADETVFLDENLTYQHLDENLMGCAEQRDLVAVLGDNILTKFIDFLYFYSHELYRMERMVERAELIKFLYLISSKLKINSKCFINLEFKYILENTYVNINPTNPVRNKRIYSTTVEITRSEESLYTQFREYDDKTNKKIFKTKLFRNKDYITCDICGEFLKIGTFSLFSSFYNIKGHYDHVMDFIQKNLRISQNKTN